MITMLDFIIIKVYNYEIYLFLYHIDQHFWHKRCVQWQATEKKLKHNINDVKT